MATMNRNVNLEEIETDAFMGIPLLKHQSIFQKFIFILAVIVGIVITFVGVMIWNLNIMIVMPLMFLPLIFGILFGCNFNEDLSIIQYLLLVAFKPKKILVSKNTEDISQIRGYGARIEEENALRKKMEDETTEEGQKRYLKRVIIVFGISMLVAIGTLLLLVQYKKASKERDIHHDIKIIEYDQNVERLE